MKIAITCGNASFRMGGEAAIPIQFFRQFRAIGHDVRLLTHARVEAELTETFSEDELADVHFVSDSLFQSLVWKLGRPLPSRLREIFATGVVSLSTEIRQRKLLRRMICAGEIDVVFAPTPISPKMLSMIRLKGVPVFFGPLNGAMDYPPAFGRRSGQLTDRIIAAGRGFSELAHRLFPAKRDAAGLFLSNPRTLQALPRATHSVPKYKSFDATVDSDLWGNVERSGDIDASQFLYVGRLVDWKAVDLAIRAVHELGGRARLTIVGDGPERPRLEALAAEGPAQVAFTGHLTHLEIRAMYPRVCALILPSLREAGGNVCMEALAAGVPVIAARWGGPADVVIDGVDGFLVPPVGEDELVAGFAKAMRRFMEVPSLSRSMGAAGRSRVLEAFSWRRKAMDIATVFERHLVHDYAGWGPRLGEAHAHHHSGDALINPAWSELE